MFVAWRGWVPGDLGSPLEAVDAVQYLQRGERAADDPLGRVTSVAMGCLLICSGLMNLASGRGCECFFLKK